jgi:predicted metal-binding membrane protein
VIAMGNDAVSYKAWCDKTKVVLTAFSLFHWSLFSYSYRKRVCLSTCQIMTSVVGFSLQCNDTMQGTP